jgi:hypothetical protein
MMNHEEQSWVTLVTCRWYDDTMAGSNGGFPTTPCPLYNLINLLVKYSQSTTLRNTLKKDFAEPPDHINSPQKMYHYLSLRIGVFPFRALLF